MRRIVVALNPPRKIHDLCFFAKTIATCLSEDPLFASAGTVVATLLGSVASLEAALVAVAPGGGAAAARRARAQTTLAALQVARAYVQTLANALPEVEARVVVARAAMAVKDARGPSKAPLLVKPGGTSGTARVYAKACDTRASYEWRVSREGDPAPPVYLPGSVRADATLSGLLPGALYLLEMRTVTKDGTSEWSEPFRFRAE